MMIPAIAAAVALCGVMTLAAFFNVLYVEALRIRPHAPVTSRRLRSATALSRDVPCTS